MEIRRQHQLALLEMLKTVDRICRENGIRYTLFAGTLLGAARHGGFIPWDDDLDLLFPRADYERFLQVAPRYLDPKLYFLQKEYSEHWPMFFSKLRKNNTACMEKFYPKDPQMHQGIYIDLFPCDNFSDRLGKGGLQYLAARLVVAKSLYRRGYLTDNTLKKATMAVMAKMPVDGLRRFAMNRAETDSMRVHSFFGASSRLDRSVYQRAWFAETVELEFEGEHYPAPAGYDALLTTLYGDWHQIPPEEKRVCKIHGAIVDLNHSYTDYLDQQKNMKIDTYSRSIR